MIYSIRITRTVVQHVDIDVEADDASDAQESALRSVQVNSNIVDWRVDWESVAQVSKVDFGPDESA